MRGAPRVPQVEQTQSPIRCGFAELLRPLPVLHGRARKISADARVAQEGIVEAQFTQLPTRIFRRRQQGFKNDVKQRRVRVSFGRMEVSEQSADGQRGGRDRAGERRPGRPEQHASRKRERDQWKGERSVLRLGEKKQVAAKQKERRGWRLQRRQIARTQKKDHRAKQEKESGRVHEEGIVVLDIHDVTEHQDRQA